MFHIIINPAGASGLAKKKWAQIQPIFDANHAEYEVHFSSLDHGIGAIVSELTQSKEDTSLIIVGGDGTMNDAVNGITDFSHVKIGYIPAGSGNDFGRGLELTTNANVLTETILKNEVVRRVDIGVCVAHNQSDFVDRNSKETHSQEVVQEYSRRFLVSSGIGFDAAICEKVAEKSRMKSFLNRLHLGKLIYGFVCIGLIFRYPKCKTTIEMDDSTQVYPRTLFSAIMNQPYEGGGFRFCPDSDGSDRMLNLCSAFDLKWYEVIRIMAGVNQGSHLKSKKVDVRESKKIHITAERPCWVHMDGEVKFKSSDIELALLDEQLSLLM